MSSSTIVLADAMKGSHVVTIDGYSRLKALGDGRGYNSGRFIIGGHSWNLMYCPDGVGIAEALYLRLVTPFGAPGDKIHVRWCILDIAGQTVPSPMWKINDFTSACIGGRPVWGIRRKDLEESAYLIDDRFRVRCKITVTSSVSTQAHQLIAVPPPDMQRHIGQLLSSQEGVDVTFEVDGETFGAHRLVLAARSSVFKAELLGPMKEKNMSHIQIDDMEASVFKAMLHFIYNDTLLEIDGDDMPGMAQHLLVAADRYGLERLKVICEDKLWYNISPSTLATTLALAEQHGCHGLKDPCFDFLMKSARNLEAVMKGDGYQHLLRSFPSFPKELAEKLFHRLRI